MSAFKAPIGTRDVLGEEGARFAAVVSRFGRTVGLFGYELVVSPMFEDVGVFRRGVGEESEVVTKEMYVFEDKGGRSLALRPEGTASVVRAYVQHRPPLPWRCWYLTPAFRYEHPQAGRYRQHHQLGAEALGSADPELDVEVIGLLATFYRALGLRRLELKLSSMGDGACMPAYRALLAGYLESRSAELCAEHRLRYSRNPLRVLDCKKPECRLVAEAAPKLADALCGPCRDHFGRVTSGLDALGIPWRHDHTLVRGLDYYTRTTFEFAATALDSAQNGLGGGGRYDGLAEALGGPPTPGIGFGTGVERILLACEAEELADLGTGVPQVFVVDLLGGRAATLLADELRRAGVSTTRAFDDRSLKAQLRQADRSGARLAVIVGPDEEATGTVTLRSLRRDSVAGPGEADAAKGPGAEQRRVGRQDLLAAVSGWLR